MKDASQLGPRIARELDRRTMTFGEFLDGPWRDEHASNKSPRTREHDRWVIRYLEELFDEPLVLIDVPRLAQYQKRLLKRGATLETTRSVMKSITGMLRVAIELGYIGANLARDVKRAKVPAPE